MAEIVKLKDHQEARVPKTVGRPVEARILLFTGVRYMREPRLIGAPALTGRVTPPQDRHPYEG
ncbi:hypothetical protein NAC44_05995 [Allorhizobium sp. BGMRC 0089]|uniref:hypothetical protein n=1 Tax=Allorhizobium sonneratiae TaxID=2934936 RepID=UPI0020343A22|nr:hypothetical protein [Allorhizobium sonneratiae]MCM2291878.1 hypothetical protein [Allorhizobium sonneratiae]